MVRTGAALLTLLLLGACTPAPTSPTISPPVLATATSTPATATSSPTAATSVAIPTTSAPSTTHTSTAKVLEPTAPSATPARAAEFVTTPSGYRIWKPSFEMLPFKEDVPKGTPAISITGHGWTKVDIELASAFYASPIPPNDCAPMPGDEIDPKVIERDAYEYANCLLDSWRPWAKEHDVPLPKDIPVTHCAIPERECGDQYEGAFAWGGPSIVLSDQAINDPSEFITRVMAHEFGHSLQSLIVPTPDSGGILGVGAGITSDTAFASRRLELQANCLGMASQNAYRPISLAEFEQIPKVGIDPDHGDLKSQDFWSKQGLKGWAGECNTMVAAVDLLTYE